MPGMLLCVHITARAVPRISTTPTLRCTPVLYPPQSWVSGIGYGIWPFSVFGGWDGICCMTLLSLGRESGSIGQTPGIFSNVYMKKAEYADRNMGYTCTTLRLIMIGAQCLGSPNFHFLSTARLDNGHNVLSKQIRIKNQRISRHISGA